jgi:hypothetical protein
VPGKDRRGTPQTPRAPTHHGRTLAQSIKNDAEAIAVANRLMHGHIFHASVEVKSDIQRVRPRGVAALDRR